MAELPRRDNLQEGLLTPPLPLDMVLPGFVRGTVGGLVSPGGLGKSFWALQVALAMAGACKDLTGFRPAEGKVLLLSAEDPYPAMLQRLHAIKAAAGGVGSLEQLDYRTCLGLSIDLSEEAWQGPLEAAAAGCRLIILDTLSRFHSLDENDARDMKALLARLERLAATTGAAVLFLHHTNKGAILNGFGSSQQAARGSSVLVDNTRWLAYMSPMLEAEAKHFGIALADRTQYVAWNTSKLNYGEAREAQWYRRGEGGVLLPVKLKPKRPVADTSVSQPRGVARW